MDIDYWAVEQRRRCPFLVCCCWARPLSLAGTKTDQSRNDRALIAGQAVVTTEQFLPARPIPSCD